MDDKLKQEIREFIDTVSKHHAENNFNDNPSLAPFYLGQAVGLMSKLLQGALQAPDAAPAPSAAATAPFEIGDHVKHPDGTTGQVVGISCESGWLHVLWDNSRACLWWSPAATTLLDDETTYHERIVHDG